MANTVQPYAVSDTNVTHVVIELFGGDNNLSQFVLEDLQEMAAGNSGRFAVIALADFADWGARSWSSHRARACGSSRSSGRSTRAIPRPSPTSSPGPS